MCQVDGEYPKFFAWCDECNDYAEGFDAFDYAADWMGDAIDQVMDDQAYDPRKGWDESILKARDIIIKRNEELDKKGTCAD